MHFSTADILRSRKQDILRMWEKEVSDKLPHTLKHSALRDSLPDFLDNISEALEKGIENVKSEISHIAEAHGEERADVPEYTVENVLQEFIVLRSVLLKILEERAPLPQKDRDIIFDVSVRGFSRAASELTQIQLKREHEAKELAQKRLEEKTILEERLSLALEVSQVGIWEYNIKKRELKWTKEEAQFFNLPEEQLTIAGGLPFSKIHPEDQQKIIENYREVFERNSLFLLEYRILLPDGRVRWISSRGRGIRDERGNPVKIIGTDIDISLRKDHENALKRLAERMTHISDVQPNLISQLDNQLRFKFANKAYERWFGINREEVLNKSVPELIGEDAWNDVKDFLNKALEGKPVSFEKLVRFRKGAKYVKVALEPFIEDHKVKGIYVSVMDISNEMKALDTVREREEEFRNLSNAMPQLGWMAHSDGYIYWFNSRWYEYTGCTPEMCLGWGWKRHHHPDYVTKTVNNFKEMIAKGTVWEDLFPLKSKDGEWRWFLSRAIPVKNEAGIITKWFGTNTDVTDQKRLTDELHREQNLMEKFVSTLSHDLRTPLTAARMSGQLIQKQIKDEEAVLKQTNRIIKSIDRVDKMIQDLLDASRLKAGQLSVPAIEKINLNEIVKHTLDDLKTIHGDRFILNMPAKIVAHTWSHGIVRIIENLCSNAVKYGSLDSPIEVTVALKENHFTMAVKNYGTPLEEGVNLFDEFQRSIAAEKSGKRGWGIGLTIVKGITDALGGEIRVIRHKNGTTFEITLPCDSRDQLPTHSAPGVIH